MDLDAGLFRKTGTILLESIAVNDERRFSHLFTDPVAIVQCTDTSMVETALREVDDHVKRGLFAAGFISYEAGRTWIPVSPASPVDGFPLVWFAIYERAERWRGPAVLPAPSVPDRPIDVHLDLTKARYADDVRRIQERIAEGDTYQVNYTCRLRFRWEDCPFQLYLRLRRSQPVPYGAFLNCGGRSIISLSPELFLARSGNLLWSRPMKGTAPRGETPLSDALLQGWLAEDPKNRAENLMIVDLMRNDFGRIASIGTVEVFDPFLVEGYPRLFQMTTGVRCRLDKEVSFLDLMRATFPPGSITGAPKISTMKIIAEMEPSSRKVYTGAIGYLAPDGHMTMSVAIRTAMVSSSGWCELGVGSGIVADSDGSAEWEETLLKAGFLNAPPDADPRILETVLVTSEGRLPRIEDHLARMSRSAAALGFPFPMQEARRIIENTVGTRTGAPMILRLLLSRLGDLHAELLPMTPGPGAAVKLVVSRHPTDRKDPLLAHKTTSRRLYDSELAQARRDGFDEVLFLNREGQLTEGAITNIFLHDSRGWRTPDLECGLLPGIWRAGFLEETGAREGVITLDDLRSARRMVVGNSVRGAMEVTRVVDPGGESLFRRQKSSHLS